MNMYLEEAAYLLAMSFSREYKKHDFRFPSINNIKNTKWWAHFLRAAELRSMENWNPDIWVKCQFEKEGKILPFQLYGKKAIDNFKEYSFRITDKDKDKESQVVSGMLSSYKKIKIWMKQNNTDKIEDFFKDTENIKKVKNGQVSKYLLSVCRPTYSIIDKEDLMAKRAYIHQNKKIKETLKSVLGDVFT